MPHVHQISGTTTARYGSSRRTTTLAGATLVFRAVEARAEAHPRARWGWYPVDPSRLPGVEVARALVADDGTYVAEIAEGVADPTEATLLVVLHAERLADAPITGKTAVGILGVVEPAWIQHHANDRSTARVDIELGQPSLCGILADLDLWLAAGRVVDCKDQRRPIAGVRVTAFDRDVHQHDRIDSATTDLDGEFLLVFDRARFRGLPSLPPPLDTIPPHELFGGPDLFFHVHGAAGPLLLEPPARGRTGGRENVGHCSYTELCVEDRPAPVGPTLTTWTRIGRYRIPDARDLHDFDANGFVAAGTLALHGDLDLMGDLAQTHAGEALSYRFVFAEWGSLTVPPPPSAFVPITAEHIDPTVPYGQLVRPRPRGPWWDVEVSPVRPEPDADGWIAVSQDPAFQPGGYPLLRVRSTVLVPDVGADHGHAGAGDPVALARIDRPRKISFALEIKTASHSPGPGLPIPVHLNNSSVFLRLALHEGPTGPSALVVAENGTLTLHPRYTVAHPYLEHYRVAVQREDGSIVVLVSDTFREHGPLWTGSASVRSSTPPAAFTFADVGGRSYRAWVSAQRRVVSGYGGRPVAQQVLRTFCVE